MKCPTCGHPVTVRLIVRPESRLAIIDGKTVSLRPLEARILEIIRRQTDPILGETIADILGTSYSSVKVTICNMRKSIFDTKLVIDSQPGRHGGYWLRWLPER